MDKEPSQTEQLQELVNAWSSMQRYAFYVGCQRGILSSMNTLCLRFAKISFEDYTKNMIKPQLNQMMTVGQCMTLLAGLLQSINELINIAESEAKKEVTAKEGANDDNGIRPTAETPKVVV